MIGDTPIAEMQRRMSLTIYLFDLILVQEHSFSQGKVLTHMLAIEVRRESERAILSFLVLLAFHSSVSPCGFLSVAL